MQSLPVFVVVVVVVVFFCCFLLLLFFVSAAAHYWLGRVGEESFSFLKSKMCVN